MFKDHSIKTSGISVVILILVLSFIVSNLKADEGFVPVYHPELEIVRTTGVICIDGQSGDPGWQGAARAGNFSEHNPGDQTKPEVDTEVFVTYDDENLYVLWICYDDPGQVRASFCERDRIFSDDYVILCLDTYGDHAFAYEIAANPYGIPGDLLFSASAGEDISYNLIFESAGQLNSEGWIVEMAIPFASIRFPEKERQEWRVDFWRNRPRESRYQYSWAAYDRDMDCWPCNWGTVRGAENIKRSVGLELLPAVVAHQSGSVGDDGEFTNGDVMGDLALGVSYDISSELTAEATINPDFSQVESDIAQLDVNSTFALFYPERRPFFQEGSDLFNTYFNAVYTRSINDPVAAGKVTWRKGRNSMAFLSARDEHSVIILPFEERSKYFLNGKSYSNILRYRRDFGNQSHVGLVATDRRFDSGGSGSLLGIDGKVRLSDSNSIRVQLLASHTEEVDTLAAGMEDTSDEFSNTGHTIGLNGESFWGTGFTTTLERSTSNYWTSGRYTGLNPTFRADNGFETSNNWQIGEFNVGGIKRFGDENLLENINASLNLARKWNFDGTKKDEWINASVEVNFRAAQTGMHSSYMASDEQYHDIQFNNIWSAHTCFHTQPWDALRLGGNINYGHRIARSHELMGKETSAGIWADVKLMDRFLINFSLSHITSNSLEDHEKKSILEDDRLFNQLVFWSRFSLQISREFSIKLVAQYIDRYDREDGSGAYFDIDPLITYRINSLTVFYLGATHDLRDMNLNDGMLESLSLRDRQYFMKIQYLFQL